MSDTRARPPLVPPRGRRVARLKGATFSRPSVWSPDMKPTQAEYEALLVQAEGGEMFPHMPDWEWDRCEFCGRPDWERSGDCLVRVRRAAHPLGELACCLERLGSAFVPARTKADSEIVMETRRALEILARLGVTPNAHRERLAERRAKRLAEEAAAVPGEGWSGVDGAGR